MKALLILKVTDKRMWYSRLVGQVVPLLAEEEDCFLTKEESGLVNIVLKSDCEVIDVGPECPSCNNG